MAQTQEIRGTGAPSPAARDTPPGPQLAGTYDADGRGRWYAGIRPEEHRAVRPVIVFVPGLGSPARSYWDKGEYGSNQLYAMACADGFRTAFVEFAAPGQRPMDMWQNGRILAWQLREICRYYGVGKVTVVAHSKGGVDAQTALVYFGAGPLVEKLVTLSTPHWGSQLADLAYSTFGWPLAERFHAHSDGCYVMQTGYMREYRRLTDRHTQNTAPIFTFGGRGSGTVFSKIWAGSQYMSQYGENDGVVTVASAHNPKGEHLATLGLNHAQMQQGQYIWNYVRASVLGQPFPAVPVSAVPAPAGMAAPAGLIYRGGRMDQGIDEHFAVDSRTTQADIAVLTADDVAAGLAGSLYLRGPAGEIHRGFRREGDIGGSQVLRLTLRSPAPGDWNLRCAPASGEFFAMVRLAGGFTMSPDETGEPEHPAAAGGIQTVLRVIRVWPDRYELVGEHRVAPGGEVPDLKLGEGLYTIESSVQGALPDGSPFERDCVRPMIVRGR